MNESWEPVDLAPFIEATWEKTCVCGHVETHNTYKCEQCGVRWRDQ